MDTRQQPQTNKNDNTALWTVVAIIVLAIIAYAVYAASNRNHYTVPADRATVNTPSTATSSGAATTTPGTTTDNGATTTTPNNTTTQ